MWGLVRRSGSSVLAFGQTGGRPEGSCRGRPLGRSARKEPAPDPSVTDGATDTRQARMPEGEGRLDKMPSWRPAPVRTEDLGEDEDCRVAMGTPHGEGRRGRRGRGRDGGWFNGGGRRVRAPFRGDRDRQDVALFPGRPSLPRSVAGAALYARAGDAPKPSPPRL